MNTFERLTEKCLSKASNEFFTIGGFFIFVKAKLTLEVWAENHGS